MKIITKQLITSMLIAASIATSSCGISLSPQTSEESLSTPKDNSTAPAFSNNEYVAEISDYEYNIPSRYYSEGIKNIVRRARQVSELHWTPLSNVIGFNGDKIFEAGKEVIGLPYGQPVYNGEFLCFDASLETFAAAVKRPADKFYTDSARYEEVAPFYSLDCSTLVCYAWARPKRMIASLLTQWGDYCGSTVSDIQVGDALIAVGDITHAVLVTGVKEDENGRVIWVEITEETPPLAKVTRYGEDELFSIAELNRDYFEKGYGVYRNTDYRDATPYIHSCASPLDGEHCSSCGEYSTASNIKLSGNAKDISIDCSYKSKDTVTFGYTVEARDYGILKYKTPSADRIDLMSSAGGGNSLYSIPEGTTITTNETQTDSSGKLWGKVRIGGKCGFVCLDKCTKLGGTMERSDFREFKAKVNGSDATAVIPVDSKDLYDGCIIHIFAVTTGDVHHEIGKVTVKKR